MTTESVSDQRSRYVRSSESEMRHDGLQSWDIRPSPRGGYDFQVNQRGRGCMVIGAALLAACWIAFAMRALLTQRAQPLGVSSSVSAVVGIALTVFAVWLKFADERYHVERNCLEHRVGIGRMNHGQIFRDAEISVIHDLNRRFLIPKPFARLYVVDAAGRHFLLERDPVEASAFADFVCRETGWARVDVPVALL